MGASPDSDLELRLRSIIIPHADDNDKSNFTHSDLIAEVLNEEVIKQLVRENGWCKPGTSKLLKYRDFNPGTSRNYITILAILLRIDCEQHIEYFIKNGLSQEVLPLRGVRQGGGGGDLKFYRRDTSGNLGQLVPLACLKKDINRKNFNETQYNVMAPRLSIGRTLGGSFEAAQEYFCEETILPWHKLVSADVPTTASGGFSQVRKVWIHDRSHDYHEILKRVRIPPN